MPTTSVLPLQVTLYQATVRLGAQARLIVGWEAEGTRFRVTRLLVRPGKGYGDDVVVESMTCDGQEQLSESPFPATVLAPTSDLELQFPMCLVFGMQIRTVAPAVFDLEVLGLVLVGGNAAPLYHLPCPAVLVLRPAPMPWTGGHQGNRPSVQEWLDEPEDEALRRKP